ncbi:hypothetical protein K040078D81_43190 [Blautia hominis]|uniref:Uncharacterized protein n=1 Tax=Blautia hominis TaxID=2025493 RepID=A0ABQ0BFH8_9FIRM
MGTKGTKIPYLLYMAKKSEDKPFDFSNFAVFMENIVQSQTQIVNQNLIHNSGT